MSLFKKKEPENPTLPPLGTVTSGLIRLGLPAIAEMLFAQTMSMIDVMMVGTVGSIAIASVGLTQHPYFILLVPFSAMNNVIGAIIARRRGESDREAAKDTLRHVLLITLLLSLALSVFGYFFTDTLLYLMGATEDLMPLARDYMKILTLGLPLQAMGLSISAMQRGEGNTKVVMYINSIGNIANVVFNYLLIGGKFGFPALGVRGAAIGTVIGQFLIVILSFIAILHPTTYARLEFKTKFRVNPAILKNIAKMASSASIDIIAIRIGLVLFIRSVIALGTDEFTFYQIITKITPLLYAVFDGLCAALLSFIGRSLGEKRPDIAEHYIKGARIVAFGISVIMGAVMLFFGNNLILMFTDEVQILRFAPIGIGFLVLQNFVYSLLSVSGYSLRGAGDVMFAALPTTLGTLIVRPVLGYILMQICGLGLIGVFATLLSDLTMRVIIYHFRLKSGKWKNKKA